MSLAFRLAVATEGLRVRSGASSEMQSANSNSVIAEPSDILMSSEDLSDTASAVDDERTVVVGESNQSITMSSDEPDSVYIA